MKRQRRYFLGLELIWLLILVAGFLFLTSIAGMAKEVTSDAPDSHDNPLISRYEGSFIIGYEQKKYSNFLLPLSAPKTWEVALEKKMIVEGEHTRIIYVAPQDRSTLEVFRNYQNELKGDNVEVLFSCEQNDCGKKEGQVLIQKILYPPQAKLKNISKVTEHAFTFPVEMRYLSAKITGAKDAYISIFVAKETFKHFEETASRTIILLDIIELEAMEKKMVVVPAEEIIKALNEKGSFSLYGIYFDTDSSVIKPESKDALVEIEKLIRQNPAMKLYIVGHTDNVGGLDYNMALSQKRGKAVMEALVKNHGVDPNFLQAFGVGMLAPKASNAIEEGRRLNRRVELVKQ